MAEMRFRLSQDLPQRLSILTVSFCTTILEMTGKTFNCTYCGREKEKTRSSYNKFCCQKCHLSWTWENVTKPRLEKGDASSNSSPTLKKYLLENRGEKCAICGLGPEWNGFRLVLQLDHIDGDSDNNKLDNLRLLCPNCHTQTDTFSSKGKGSRYKKNTLRNTYLQAYKSKSS